MNDVQPDDPRQDLSEDRVMPGVAYGLYLLGPVTGGVTMIIGLIVAYANLADAGPRTFSHYRFLIRTFWLSIAWLIIAGGMMLFGAPLSLVLIGLPFLWLGWFIFGAVGVWYLVRCVVGLIFLGRGDAYPRPRTWLI
jgi:uncharacterized membrane protein